MLRDYFNEASIRRQLLTVVSAVIADFSAFDQIEAIENNAFVETMKCNPYVGAVIRSAFRETDNSLAAALLGADARSETGEESFIDNQVSEAYLTIPGIARRMWRGVMGPLRATGEEDYQSSTPQDASIDRIWAMIGGRYPNRVER